MSAFRGSTSHRPRRPVSLIVGRGGFGMHTGDSGGRTAEEFVDLKLFDGPPGIPDRVLLYEGLPHQEGEWEVFRVERGRADTMELDGFPFYTELLPLRPEDAAELTALLSDHRSFRPYRGGKRCG